MFLKLFSIIVFLISCLAHAVATVTIITSDRKTYTYAAGFSGERLKEGFGLLKEGQLSSITQEVEFEQKIMKTVFSSDKYNAVDRSFHLKWKSASQFTPTKLPINIIAGNAFHIHPQKGLGTFYFSNFTKKNPIMYTTELADCVAVIGYNQETKQGFFAHIPFWDEDFEKNFRSAAKKLQGSSTHDQVQIYLVTLVASNISVERLEMIQKLNFSVHVHAVPGMLEIISAKMNTMGKLKPYIKQFVSPELLDSETYLSQFVAIRGRSLYFDTRDGMIYEGQAVGSSSSPHF